MSARLPHSMQHVESGENLVKILIAREVAGRRRSASRLYALHPDRRRRHGSRADGLASRSRGTMRRRDDRCFVFDRVTSQARRYYV